jgi:hypothetical protein
MKTKSKNGHRPGDTGSVTDLDDESCLGNGTMNELAVMSTKAKTSNILRAGAQVFAEHGYHLISLIEEKRYTHRLSLAKPAMTLRPPARWSSRPYQHRNIADRILP